MRKSSEVRIFDSSMLFTLSNSPGAPSISEHLGSKFGGDDDAGEKRGKSSCLKEKFNINTYCFVAFVQLVFQERKA